MKARLLLVALLVLPISAAPPDKAAIKWAMKPHDFLHFASSRWVGEPGKQTLQQFLEHPVDLFGCDFDKDGHVALRAEGVNDVPLPLVFQAPDRPVSVGERWRVACAYDNLWTFPRLVAAGVAEYTGVEPLDKVSCHVWKGVAAVTEEKGKIANVGIEWLEGRVEWKTWFEVTAGLARRVELTFTAKYIGKPKPPGGKPTELVTKEELTRCTLWPYRYGKFQEAVDKAIDQGVAWVKGKQKADGTWDGYGDSYGVGPTALALLTLIKGGVKHDDPSVQKALDWVVKQPFAHTYEVSLSICAVDAYYTPPGEQEGIRRGQIKEYKRDLSPAHQKWMKGAVDWLAGGAMHSEGDWGYPSEGADMSNTQYAVLGLHAGGRCGVWADDSKWLAILKRAETQQEKKGPPVKYIPKEASGSQTEVQAQARGWMYGIYMGGRYLPDTLATASMTCAGLAVVALARDALIRTGSKKWSPAEDARALTALKDGVGWLSEHYGVRWNDPRNRDWYWYCMYGLERAGTLADFERLAGHDWYYEGACVLVANQFGDGHWQDSGSAWLWDSCFAILFLKRATTALPTK